MGVIVQSQEMPRVVWHVWPEFCGLPGQLRRTAAWGQTLQPAGTAGAGRRGNKRTEISIICPLSSSFINCFACCLIGLYRLI